MTELETDRLLLRMFREDDLEEYAEIVGDPEVTRYLSDGRPLARWEAWRQMAMILGHWQLKGYGPWAVQEKSSGRLLGRIGFFNPEGWPGFELGWVLKRDSWGKGYATEGARRALDYGLADMGRDHIISLIHPENLASIRVAERLGEKLEGRTRLFDHDVLIYGISFKA
jgi:RimJ/RimL family protein N-acetyltransferase